MPWIVALGYLQSQGVIIPEDCRGLVENGHKIHILSISGTGERNNYQGATYSVYNNGTCIGTLYPVLESDEAYKEHVFEKE